jgi:60 kDa SS-A/Ro ribonucleoprotein
MTNYSKHVSVKKTPQTQPIPGKSMVENQAGGYSFEVSEWMKVKRFLILGTEGGSYYATEKDMTLKSFAAMENVIRASGVELVKEIVDISQAGRAPKNDPCIFALAACMSFGDVETKKAAAAALPQVCRIGTHLFHFAEYVTNLRGWGRLLKNAVADWYLGKSAGALSLQVTKYQQRDGWSHRDLLRLSHVKADSDLFSNILQWCTHGTNGWEDKKRGVVREGLDAKTFAGTPAKIIYAFEQAKTEDGKKGIISLIKDYNLPHECIPSQFKSDPDVQLELLQEMPFHAILRNLGNFSKSGLLAPGKFDIINFVVDKLSDVEMIRKSRVHPIDVLKALLTYGSGMGVRGSGSWTPVTQVVDALNRAFYTAFGNVEPTGKNIMLALDLSASMTWVNIAGCPGLTPRVGSAAMALVTQAVEKNVVVTGFTADSTNRRIPSVSALDISSKQRISDVCQYIEGLDAGGTDCSLPILYALKNNLNIDLFVVYTDSETWAGKIHPTQALAEYRKKINPNARSVVVGMVSNGFSIADPDDSGMLDLVGFDTATPNLISQFALGNI